MGNEFAPVKEQMDLIRRGTEDVLPEEELERRLAESIKSGTPLKVKLGADPSRPDLHIGHAVVLQKLRDFQDLGHQAILIIGDFTAMIGDPSGKSKTRPALSLDETRQNGQTYFDQATKILSSQLLKITYNSEWLAEIDFAGVIQLASTMTVAQILEREDFSKRYNSGVPISMHELLYPLVQARDSVAVRADVELGGTDQTFNLLVGRDLQRHHGQREQVIITCPLLVGTDGTEKMSKSLDNYIALNDFPGDIYGKTLSIPDELMPDWFRLTLFYPDQDVEEIAAGLKSGELHPRDVKRRLARELVARFSSEKTAEKAEAEFDQVFIKKDVPDDINYFTVPAEISLLDLMVEAGLTSSKGEGRRLIQGGGVSIDGEKVEDPALVYAPENEVVLKVGKRKFLRLVPGA